MCSARAAFRAPFQKHMRLLEVSDTGAMYSDTRWTSTLPWSTKPSSELRHPSMSSSGTELSPSNAYRGT